MNNQSKGLLLTALGVILVSPDTLLIRLVEMNVWNLAAWRGILQAIGLSVLLAAFYGRHMMKALHTTGRYGFAVAVIVSANTLAFLVAVEHTAVANVLIILASAPFFAALMSLVLLKEPVAVRTWLAIVAIIGGIGLIAWDALGRGTLLGEGMAILAAILLASKIILVRHQRHINMVPAIALSSLMYAATAAVVNVPTLPSTTQTLLLLLMGFAVLTPAAALLALGPRYISAPEVSLLVLLETVLGPLWVWLVIKETPGQLALVGGALVVTTMIAHSALGLRQTWRSAK